MGTARRLVAAGTGLLAMDERNSTCDRQFADPGIPRTGEARRDYRDLIVTTLRLGDSSSGAIRYDETIEPEVLAGERTVERYRKVIGETPSITVKCLLRVVPAAVPGIAFSSDGQSGELVSTRLNAMNVMATSRASRSSWPLEPHGEYSAAIERR
jgi:fructose-bisphosphate aldolase class 1